MPDRWIRTGFFNHYFFFGPFNLMLRKLFVNYRDIAVIDENGYGQIVGRAKDMLIRGGMSVPIAYTGKPLSHVSYVI